MKLVVLIPMLAETTEAFVAGWHIAPIWRWAFNGMSPFGVHELIAAIAAMIAVYQLWAKH